MKRPLAASAAAYAALSAYYRFRPQPPGVNGELRTYRLPADQITFLHDTVWMEDERRRNVRQITSEVTQAIRQARSFVLLDVFLFNLHHASGGHFIPTTRQVADAFAASEANTFFITDPFNTSYGTQHNEPFDWLREAGVRICVSDLRPLRDPNLIYSPLWRLFLQRLGTGRRGLVNNPLRQGEKTTLRAFLRAFTLKANHRKVLIADAGASGDYVTMVTSSNFEDSSSYFCNVALKIRSRAVARHFLEAEKAVARMSGCRVPFSIPQGDGAMRGEATVTPLMGAQIKQALLRDLEAVGSEDQLYVLILFLSDRNIVRALKRADRRGAAITLVMDPNRVSFGEEKGGFPNQYVAAELARETGIDLRWANVDGDEFHTKCVLIEKASYYILHVGSANLDRLSLSNTNLEANVRVCLPAGATVSRQVLAYVRRASRPPISRRAGRGDPSRIKYWWYRLQEVTGATTF